MTREGTRSERQSWKQRQEERLTEPNFSVRRVAPLLPELTRSWDHMDSNVELVRSKATSRMTLRYTFGKFAVVYAKVYFDASVGRSTHSSLAHLWKQGFAAGSGLEVPEPMGFIEEANLVVMRRAEGTPLNELVAAGSLEHTLCGTRAAARWLAKYHSTEFPGLEIESPVEQIEILNLADSLAKAAAECRDCPSLLIGMLHDLESVAPRSVSSPPIAPLHGQFRPAHVFVEGSRATVIDVEKICLSDPAKDVARFVHALKKTCFEHCGNIQRADHLAQEFIAEYRKLAPSNLENLAYFRALLAFKAIAKILKSRKGSEDERQAAGEMYRLEFDQTTRAQPLAAQYRESCHEALIGREMK
jgi:aminoglycoside phosphotransferase (APT) family kinase protein